jgi:hypothetical protein
VPVALSNLLLIALPWGIRIGSRAT